ncbi:PREDICTED: nuclear pore complex protein Nup214 isoform X2 [Vollenhovia emeryi]|uniref:nuclear pore complex protein Nup214 isoform X2 n=1 Tax=Vollenhovia emeryi TaxID=411798 RepID=UPI0005F58D02|nr:PREDICTED: nuclear pore complex protein Nup214 isoform X2 [Vollenhovia emeryi]
MKALLDPIYVEEFLFKQSNTYQVFDLKTPAYIPAACSLLAADKKRGLLYVGHDDKVTVLKPADESNAEWQIELQLPGVISKIAINCDYNYIAIGIALKPTVLIYDAHSLARNSLNLLVEITPTNKLDSYITDIRWNPTVPSMFCIVTSDCTIGSFLLKVEEENFVPKVSVISKVSSEPQALCAAWSPKGKQIAVGCKNGDIVQLKPDTLKVARAIAGPSPSIGEVISILWLSNYQFCAAYLNGERYVNVLIVDAPKGEASAIFTCYGDIMYSFPEGEDSVPRYYLEHVPEWGLIIAGSSTSSEIAMLGTADGGANWNQWQLVDSGRAQLPLMRTTEIYPLGLAVDKSPTGVLPWGTDSTLPHPVPILHILGTSGKLCSFHMVNLAPNCPAINVPPTEIVAPPAPSQPHAVAPAEMSFSINAAVTSTPRSKPPEMAPERSKPAPMNIFGDSLKTAGFFQPPVEQAAEQPKPQEEKAVPQTVAKPIAPKEAPVPEPTKTTEIKAVADKEASSPQATEQKASIDDSIRMRAYVQEQALFEKELRTRLEPQVWECGTDAEKKQLGETSVFIEQFLRELKETTNSLSSDITYLKALLLQSFAWVEETKSKNAASVDITARNCNENSKIADLQRWYYYIHTQLNQVNKILDLEWSEHKAQAKSRMKIPSLEYVYQNLVTHNKIIAKEKEKLEQVSRRWKSLNRSMAADGVSNLNRSMASLHVSLPRSSASVISYKTDVIDTRCKAIAMRTLSFTHEKQLRLSALLTESSPRIIKPVNPSPVQDRLKATLSSLASLSPVVSEARTKPEPPIVKQSVAVKQPVDKQAKSQSPLASLNSIVARIGTPDTNGVVQAQTKVQQKPLPTAVSFSGAISTKQTDKKPAAPAVLAASQSKPKQELNVNFPTSITFGAPAPKTQDTLFSKSLVADMAARNNKDPASGDGVVKAPESALFSTGLLKDVLSTDYPLAETARMGIARNLLPLSAAPAAAKTDAAATFSFATANMLPPPVAKGSPSALDMMSFAYSKSAPAVEPAMAIQATGMQTPIELSALSLGSAGALTLQSADHLSAGAKANATTTSMSFATPAAVIAAQAPAMTAAVTSVMTIGGVTISVVDANAAQKPMTEVPSSSAVIVEKVITAPEMKAPSFGTASAQAAILLAPSIFGGGQTVAKSTATTPEAIALPATTSTFGVVSFPSIAPTFGTTTTASVFGGFANAPAGVAATSPSAVPASTAPVSPFQASLSKPTFSETAATATSAPATSFGTGNAVPASTISFGLPAATSITPAFDKSPIVSPASNAHFPTVQTPASTANIFGKPIISPASTPFGGTSSSVFSNAPASTSSNTSVFGGNSIFGSTAPSGNIFGGNTGFGAASTGSIFDTGAPKPGIVFGGATSAPASPFGGATANASSPAAVSGSPAGANVFRSTVSNASPIQQPVLSSQPTFGQAPAFGAKPVFGSSPIFGGAKPVFGGAGFSSPPAFESPPMGFGSPPTMQPGSTMENMPKVFGEVTGSSTFESLANQSGGLSFGSLAQKNPEPEKPTFTAGSSFSSWR